METNGREEVDSMAKNSKTPKETAKKNIGIRRRKNFWTYENRLKASLSRAILLPYVFGRHNRTCLSHTAAVPYPMLGTETSVDY